MLTSRRKRPGDPEAEKIVPCVGGDRAAVCRTEDPRNADPGAAAEHPATANAAGPGRAIGRSAFVIIVRAIFHPFRYIAVDLIEPPRVGLEGIHRHRPLAELA